MDNEGELNLAKTDFGEESILRMKFRQFNSIIPCFIPGLCVIFIPISLIYFILPSRKALRMVEKEDIRGLMKMAGNHLTKGQQRAIYYIAGLGDLKAEEAVPFLIRTMLATADYQILNICILSLGKIGTVESAKGLARLLQRSGQGQIMTDDTLFIEVSKQLQRIAYSMEYQNLDEFLDFLGVKM